MFFTTLCHDLARTLAQRLQHEFVTRLRAERAAIEKKRDIEFERLQVAWVGAWAADAGAEGMCRRLRHPPHVRSWGRASFAPCCLGCDGGSGGESTGTARALKA